MTTPKKTDSPAAITYSVSDLDHETDVEPFVLGTPKGLVTFPNPLDWEVEDAEEFLADFTRPDALPTELLAKWLTQEDFDRLKSCRLKLRQLQDLFAKVNTHYGHFLGTPGE